MATTADTVHLGQNIKRIRELLHIKQENFGDKLARATGEEWSQQRISLLESRSDIDSKLLDIVAKALEVTPEAIKQYSEEAAIQIFCNTFQDNASNMANYRCTINQNDVDRILNLAEDNKRLYEELLKEKDARIRLLEQLHGTSRS